MDFSQILLLLSIVTMKTLGVVIENTFTTQKTAFQNFYPNPDYLQYVVYINKYGLDLSGFTTITFEVKACHAVKIVLSNSDDGDSSKPMYNVFICGAQNQRSGFQRRNDDPLSPDSQINVSFDTLDLCSCNEYRPFWVSAINGDLKTGTGLVVGTNVIAECTDPYPFRIRSIGLFTNQQILGEWRVQLEVVNNHFDGSFSRCTTNYKAALNILFSTNNTSLLQCAALCDKLPSCIGLNYYNQSLLERVTFQSGYHQSSKVEDSLSASCSHLTMEARLKQMEDQVKTISGQSAEGQVDECLKHVRILASRPN
ncbi:uncharacterized protein LOC134717633 [Mytilus trossulus]|uniref:uncharacterized protein LOC134717633 n=1 Tax=Mytilus trossulus TaxID=6551 RepID=UPI003005F7FC